MYLAQLSAITKVLLTRKVQVTGETFSYSDRSHDGRTWRGMASPALERSNSDPVSAANSGLLVQRVTPTVRRDTNSLPYPSHGKAARPLSPFLKERSDTNLADIGGSESGRGNSTPSPEDDLRFSSNYVSDHAHLLSSTPMPRTREYSHSQQQFAAESVSEQISALKAKCSELESQLKVQTDINKELKRLLVASMGNDLQHRLSQIAEEKATISHDLDTSLQQLADNHEEIDRVSIECDIWRSKFLASRLMIDELAGWKAEVSRQLRDCQRALQSMLKEHAELSKALIQCNHHLNGIGMSFKMTSHNGELDDEFGALESPTINRLEYELLCISL